MCTIGYVLPYTCLLPDLILNIYITSWEKAIATKTHWLCLGLLRLWKKEIWNNLWCSLLTLQRSESESSSRCTWKVVSGGWVFLSFFPFFFPFLWMLHVVFSYCCHSTVDPLWMKHEASSISNSFSLSLSFPLAVCVSGVASSIWISRIENHFTRAKSRMQHLTEHRVTTIKRAAPFSFLLPAAPWLWKVLLLSHEWDWLVFRFQDVAIHLTWISPGRRSVTFWVQAEERVVFLHGDRARDWNLRWLHFPPSLFIVWCLAQLNLSACVCVRVYLYVWAIFRFRLSSDQRLASQCPRLTPQEKCPSQHWISHMNKQASLQTTGPLHNVCIIHLLSSSNIFHFCWMAGKHTSLQRNRLSPTFILSTFVLYWHDCNWLQWNSRKVLLYSTPPPLHTLTLLTPSPGLRHSRYFVRSHPSPLETFQWWSWSLWKQHDSGGSPELLFKLCCSKKKEKWNNPSEILLPVLFGICGCVLMSTATLLMQTMLP